MRTLIISVTKLILIHKLTSLLILILELLILHWHLPLMTLALHSNLHLILELSRILTSKRTTTLLILSLELVAWLGVSLILPLGLALGGSIIPLVVDVTSLVKVASWLRIVIVSVLPLVLGLTLTLPSLDLLVASVPRCVLLWVALRVDLLLRLGLDCGSLLRGFVLVIVVLDDVDDAADDLLWDVEDFSCF